jgi:hypothetical protein
MRIIISPFDQLGRAVAALFMGARFIPINLVT